MLHAMPRPTAVTRMTQEQFIIPDWPAPPRIHACTSTRLGGVSRPPYAGLNLAFHVGDAPRHVRENRTRLRQRLQLPHEPLWLRQVHGTCVVDGIHAPPEPEADGSFAGQPGIVCAVLTADCLPLLLCDRQGTRVAAVHAGWRGLSSGVIESAIDALQVPGENLLAWLGPAIGPSAFEVGPEVRSAFLAHDPRTASAFSPSPAGRWHADLYELARHRLHTQGVQAVHGGGMCTFADEGRFYSYRRDKTTGRMASVIWIEPPAHPRERPWSP